MYLKHFGLDRPPFKITPDTSLFYEGGNRGAILIALGYAILQGEGIIKVVGEVGSGKTMLCRMLEIKLPDTVDIVYIANPSLSPDNILHVIASELRLDVEDKADKLRVMQVLQTYLLKKHAEGQQVVIFIEEAQGMPLATLEEIRLLSNLETEQNKLLQMVLFGQPELDINLGKPEIRQLKERIVHHFELEMFDKSNIQSYLNFRMRAAGYRGPDLFTNQLANVIARYSKGLTRRINIIADKALLSAYSENSNIIKKNHIKVAAEDSQIKVFNIGNIYKSVAASVLAISFMAAGWLLSGYMGQTSEASPTKKQSGVYSSHDQISVIKNLDNLKLKTPGQKIEFEYLSLLEQRLRATLGWLEEKNKYLYSIQLMLLEQGAETKLENFLITMSEQNQLDETYVYQAQKNGKIIYGELFEKARRQI